MAPRESTTSSKRIPRKTILFGDSFVGIFKLIKNPEIKINKYKGATAKGLGKETNENRLHILKQIATYKPECAIFNFGSVDVHFSYFFKQFATGFKNFDAVSFIQEIAVSYVKFISTLPTPKKYIICPYYNPVSDEFIASQLLNYGIITESQLQSVDKTLLQKYMTMKSRNHIVDLFNSAVKILCKKYNIHYINLNPIISRKGVILPKYRDVSKVNIHLVWETLIQEFLPLLSDCGIKKEFLTTSNYISYYHQKQQLVADWQKNTLKFDIFA